ncbi:MULTISPECIES: hypothetical protein [Brenneria]|uniref:Uncharacterized protein n=1 Tax=Brenneria nigrifluens DSM 30175 = ATCC 13028 TaxID=1121120 RepID=A0A2U1UW09_9GAMM|nr:MULTISPECIES: hypothetical protein [Brenneria]EHD22809.1 hypothetical protein BrE312_3449 [Brenneria sp. EniD312]PWC25837.1 hypothetical protein DDT54_00430 [Brenneria nigrifluens DSM 30175 = ATCC 13028]QCR05779.1 hypothetical protein EH206_17285 [Brenneria nigrifluens DSM 30175 = ATCC 13028]
MKPLLLATALFSPLAISAPLHLSSENATMTIEMSSQSTAPIKFEVIGNGPAINDIPGVCEISGEAPFWAGTDTGLSWMYLSPDKKTMVLIKGRSDDQWTVLSLIPFGFCGVGAENAIDGVYTASKK